MTNKSDCKVLVTIDPRGLLDQRLGLQTTETGRRHWRAAIQLSQIQDKVSGGGVLTRLEEERLLLDIERLLGQLAVTNENIEDLVQLRDELTERLRGVEKTQRVCCFYCGELLGEPYATTDAEAVAAASERARQHHEQCEHHPVRRLTEELGRSVQREQRLHAVIEGLLGGGEVESIDNPDISSEGSRLRRLLVGSNTVGHDSRAAALRMAILVAGGDPAKVGDRELYNAANLGRCGWGGLWRWARARAQELMSSGGGA